jgi:rod shape determining protein RodA
MRFSRELRYKLVERTSFDKGLMVASLAIAAVSVLVMSSAASTVGFNLFARHVFWLGLGLVGAFAISFANYRRLADTSAVIYGMGLAALILVEIIGTKRLGATRWLSLFGISFQPAELAKLATAWWLARYLAGQDQPLPARVVLASLAIVAPPLVLVLLQPDLGTSSVFLVIWVGMVWAAGLSGRWLATMGLVMVALVPIGWHWLHEYQRQRVLVFLNPQRDPLGAGYTIIQSTIAIGSGGLTGQGWRSGPQSQLSFLPEHHSDFIFSVIGEEWGFVGGLIVIGLFVLLLWRILRVAERANDAQGRLLAVGVAVWIGYQACVNMGMVMGLLPVVGVPLPFISYGGTSMLMLWLTIGLVQSIHRYGSD